MQQHEALATQLPAFQARVLSGADNIDFWTEQWIWDDVLKGIDIVISTHQVRIIIPVETQLCALTIQVLLDALIHGFLRMDRLALLVFDEGEQVPVLLYSVHCR